MKVWSKMRRLFFVRGVFLSLILSDIVLAGRGAVGQPTVAAELAPSGKLRVGRVEASEVLGKRQPDGSYAGVAPDLGKFIAAGLGVDYEAVLYANSPAFNRSIGKGEWDISIAAHLPSYADTLDFSPDFMVVDFTFVSAPGHIFATADAVDRSGVRVGVSQGSTADALLTPALKSAQIVRLPTGQDAAADALRDNRIDVFGDNALSTFEISQRITGATLPPGRFSTISYAIAMPKGRSATAQARLAALVKDARSNGFIQRAIERAGLKGTNAAA